MEKNPFNDWEEVTKRNPCPICNKTSWCSITRDGSAVLCRRVETGSKKTKCDKNGTEFFIHQLGAELLRWEANAKKTERPSAICASVDELHLVNSALLSQLPLYQIHADNLRSRGLSDDEILFRGYRSFPRPVLRSVVAKKLYFEFGEILCSRIPGFYFPWIFGSEILPALAGAIGMVVPVRNLDQKIIALKIRSDSAEINRYSYLSSKRYGGPGPGAQVHIPLFRGNFDGVIRVTEGELKADVATALSGILTVSIPGVSNWKPVLPVLKSLNATKVILAFDSDVNTNPHVARALVSLYRAIKSEGYTQEMESWK